MSSQDMGSSSSNIADEGSDREQSPVPSLLFTDEGINDDDARDHARRKVSSVSDFAGLIKEGNVVLEEIHTALAASQIDTATMWLRDIEQIKDLPSRTKRPTIAIIGATGAGKSSLINCLLGPMALLPTNCVRACTAVPTEISLNVNMDGPPHRAEVEFISAEDWRIELKSLLGDILEVDGSISKDVEKKGSEAQVAFWKFKAVYPDRCRNASAQLNIETLMQTPGVRDVLGTRQCFTATVPEDLQKNIKMYVDSKDKAMTATTSRTKTIPSQASIEYWPLIRRISIQTRAPILETGCVLVDLPGVGDSNKARSSVAASYLQHYTSVWIVAPISRAVDDGHAKQLLGETFKRQMFRDGTLDRTTFVCSKIDDIKVEEARSNFAPYPEFAKIIDSIDTQRDANLREVSELERDISSREGKSRQLEQRLQCIKDLQLAYKGFAKAVGKGKMEYPLIPANSCKRKSPPEGSKVSAKKRSKGEDNDPSTTQSSEAAEATEQKSSQCSSSTQTVNVKRFVPDRTQPALTLPKIEEKLRELREQRIQTQDNLIQVKDDIDQYRSEMEDLCVLRRAHERAEWLACVKQRNLYAVGALKADFIAAIQDISRTEAEKDDLNFDPTIERSGEEDIRKYDLPVYCVSSYGYNLSRRQQNGTSQGGSNTGSFEQIADTGIPSLVEHARQAGSRYLQQVADDYINEMNRLLTSLKLWSGDTPSDVFEESKIMVQENIEVSNMVATFFDTLRNSFSKTIANIANSLISQVTGKFPQATVKAMENITAIYRRWEMLHWSIYKAVARRNGRYVKAETVVDFHEDLLQPFTERLDPVWNMILNEKVPKTMDECLDDTATLMEVFKKNFRAKLISRCAPDTSIHAFEEQADRFSHSIQAKVQKYKDEIQAGQREANRLFVPSVEEHMLPVYPLIENEMGPGCYKRMKQTMHEHVQEIKDEMFASVREQSSKKLDSVQKQAGQTLTKQILQSTSAFHSDCAILAAKKPTGTFLDLDPDKQAAIKEALSNVSMPFGTNTETAHTEEPNSVSPEPQLDIDDSDEPDWLGDEDYEPVVIDLSDDDDDFLRRLWCAAARPMISFWLAQ